MRQRWHRPCGTFQRGGAHLAQLVPLAVPHPEPPPLLERHGLDLHAAHDLDVPLGRTPAWAVGTARAWYTRHGLGRHPGCPSRPQPAPGSPSQPQAREASCVAERQLAVATCAARIRMRLIASSLVSGTSLPCSTSRMLHCLCIAIISCRSSTSPTIRLSRPSSPSA